LRDVAAARTAKPGAASMTRAAILDATVRIMIEEGYAAVSSRRVALKAGLKSQLVYYHFGTMDELFLAVFRREEARFLEAHARAFASKAPLRALWRLNSGPAAAALGFEFLALSNHRKVIQDEIARSTERVRRLQGDFIAGYLGEKGGAGVDAPPELLAFLLVTLSRGLVSEAAVGVETAHAAVFAAVERWLQRVEGADPAAEPGPG
jgi:AcrR family transcriptional regulator